MIWMLAFLPLLSALALRVLGARSRQAIGAAAGLVLAATIAIAMVAASWSFTGDLEWSTSLRLTAELTPVAALMAILVPTIALPITLYAAGHESERGLGRLVAWLLAFVGGMELLVIAADFLTLLIGWELVGACSWALIAHERREVQSPQAARYAFLMTRFGDLGLFVAAVATFAATGSFSYAGLSTLSQGEIGVVAGGLVLSAAAKSAQLPFSPWLFRAMAGPTSVSALLHAAAMVAAGAYLLIRLEPALVRAEGFASAVMAIGLATALAGGIVAVVQSHAKKLLAASTSAHFGLMFVAVGAGYPGVALLHLITHAAFKALLFLAAGVAGERAGTFELKAMGYGRTFPLIASFSAVGALALAGVPPLGGAWSKESIVAAAGHESIAIAGAVILAGGLTGTYAMRFQVSAYGRTARVAASGKTTALEAAGIASLALLTVASSLLWIPFVHETLSKWLSIAIPTSNAWELAASFVFVALGLLAGVRLAARVPSLGSAGAPAIAANWLGLPSLIDRVIVRPVERLARIAAELDDRVIDGLPRSAGTLARAVARLFTRRDDPLFDALPRYAGLVGGAVGRRLAPAGEWRIDAVVDSLGAMTNALARVGSGIGERFTDGIAEGSARLIGAGGGLSQRVASGLSHHYYVLLYTGAALAAVLLMVLS